MRMEPKKKNNNAVVRSDKAVKYLSSCSHARSNGAVSFRIRNSFPHLEASTEASFPKGLRRLF